MDLIYTTKYNKTGKGRRKRPRNNTMHRIQSWHICYKYCILWAGKAFSHHRGLLDEHQPQSFNIKIQGGLEKQIVEVPYSSFGLVIFKIILPMLSPGGWHKIFVWSTYWLGGCNWWGSIWPTNIVLLINPLAVFRPPSLRLLLSKSPATAVFLHCQF